MHKRGILGGTFDPVHWGHLLIAETALNQMALEQVIWVPTRCPVHKQAAMFEQRLEMVQRAIADNPAFVLSPASAKRYATETLTQLKSAHPNTHWYWIIGLDAFQTLPKWYRRQELAAACDWLVAPRLVSAAKQVKSQNSRVKKATLMTDNGAGCEDSTATLNRKQLMKLDQSEETTQTQDTCEQVAQQLSSEDITIQWQILPTPWVGFSSSLIRQYCSNGYSIRYLVPEAVRSYIAMHKLYSD